MAKSGFSLNSFGCPSVILLKMEANGVKEKNLFALDPVPYK